MFRWILKLAIIFSLLTGGYLILHGSSSDRVAADTKGSGFLPASLPQALGDAVRTRIMTSTGRSADSIDLYTTDRSTAAKTFDFGVTSNEDVWVFVAHGDFIDNSMSVPLGGIAPRASTLVFVVDRATGELLDWGADERAQIEVSGMGPAESIAPK